MTGSPHRRPLRAAVLGAGGRAGRAVSQALLARGHHVTGVVRDTRRHPALRDHDIELVEGDATSGADLAAPLSDTEVVVVAVTPFPAPPASFAGFDERFYERVLDAVIGSVRRAPATPTRLITVGQFATLTMAGGRRVMDDPDLFPPRLRPFARAHARELPLLRQRATGLDWLIATPPAGLHAGTGPAGGYVLADPPLDPGQVAGTLTYGQLARAIADQAETPTVHQAQVAVLAAERSGDAAGL
jgi:putative NADH-flavin reductase